MVTAVGSSILSSLGASNIDTASLVDQLATAAIANKAAALTKKETANTTKISDLANAINTITTFSSSLASLISGGSLYTQPTSSNTSLVQVSAVAGARLSGLSATIEVQQLATAQTMTSAPLSGSNAAIGEGTLQLKVGDKTATIKIDSTNNTAAGLAKAIKDANLGVTASLVTDSTGTRLVVKGQTGEDNAFSLTKLTGDDVGIGRFTFDPATYDEDNVTGLTLKQEALNAELIVDGVAVSKASNSFSDVLDGVKIDLQGAAPGTKISIGANQPTEAIKQAVSDIVDAYNEARSTLSKMTGVDGSLRSDSGIRSLVTKLSQLTTTKLTYPADPSSPSTLAEIGVKTNRDGTLTLDAAKLSSVMTSNPEAVEAMFNPGQRSSSPLIQITSPIGKTPGGIYTVTNVKAATSNTAASATLDGQAMLPSGSDSVQSSFFAASAGLIFKPLGDVASATISIDLGIAGALEAIKTSLTASSGALTASQTRLDTEKKTISDEKEKLTVRDAAYREQLTKQYTSLQTRLRAYSSTQSFITQQIEQWNKSNN
ncbi:flagellar filament capping protein FliD [Sphingomonas montanisoli]|uniref:Flagellar hook-associated protein 2 n=1 Tax=Sphingomonas montanisoli TaxID=2606412 RepID=A0A5D9CCS1_9SPHN|nr:flagellar filament capping protein FliD [Sphingomonas montanisoli]TZG28942.1 flagellar filament capping protein FliD [Sphingomonas montanisoli]